MKIYKAAMLLTLLAAASSAGAFASNSALGVKAAEVGDKLPNVTYNSGIDLAPELTIEDVNEVVATKAGDIRYQWLADVTASGNYDSPDADVQVEIELFDAGTTQTEGVVDFDESKVFTSFYDDEGAFTDADAIRTAIKSYYIDHLDEYEPGHYTGARLRFVDLKGVYEDGDWTVATNTYDYNPWQLPDYSEVRSDPSIAENGDLTFSWLNDVGNFIGSEYVDYVSLQFGFFPVGDSYVEAPTFNPETDEFDVVMTIDTHTGVGYQNIIDAFEKALVQSDSYYGIVARYVPRASVTNNPFVASKDWTVFQGSHQYFIDEIDWFGASSIYTTAGNPEGASAMVDGNIGTRWQMASADGSSWVAHEDKDIYVLLDLHHALSLDGLTITWENARAEKYDVYFGFPYIDPENAFAEGFLDDWAGVTKVSVDNSDHEQEQDWAESIDIKAEGRYLLLHLKTPFMQYGYCIGEIDGSFSLLPYSGAYYTAKHVLDALECQDFSGDSAKAKEVNAMLEDLTNSLSEEDWAKLETEIIDEGTENKHTYAYRLQYLLERSAFYSGGGSAALIVNDGGSYAYIAVLASLLVVGGGAAFLLIKRKSAR